jgi:hypothetical protein
MEDKSILNLSHESTIIKHENQYDKIPKGSTFIIRAILRRFHLEEVDTMLLAEQRELF